MIRREMYGASVGTRIDRRIIRLKPNRGTHKEGHICRSYGATAYSNAIPINRSLLTELSAYSNPIADVLSFVSEVSQVDL